jgi:hypothetical protein
MLDPDFSLPYWIENMLKKILLTACLASLVAGCGKTYSSNVDLDSVPVTEIVATHAFETESKITDLVFVPNDVAPWLGRLVSIDLAGNIYTTDIEGRSPDKTGSNKYRALIGLNRSQAAGVFLTINTSGKLEAFIESNDDGQFSAMRTSGPAIDIDTFCATDQPSENSARLVTKTGDILKLQYKISPGIEGQLPGGEFERLNENIGGKPAEFCASSGERIFLIEAAGNQSELKIYNDGDWTSVRFPSPISSIAPFMLSDSPKLALLTSGQIFILNSETSAVEHRLVVNSGLSIRGLEFADIVSTTQSNFGGGAFNEGMIAFSQSDENRIVFISLDYLSSVLTDGV